ncbi:MAG TPA: PIN domain-containing protein [Pirellulales bacterium]|nr:PIN domain-containing protein [Pirellulales bacterium]
MAIIILRCLLLMVSAGLGVGLINSPLLPKEPTWIPWGVFIGCLALAGIVIGLDVLVRRKRIETMSAVYFGLLVGVLLTYVVRLALTPLLPDPATLSSHDAQRAQQIMYWVLVGLGAIICYTCISLLIQTKDDFRFIIPYVEFSKEIKGRRPCILDTSVVIDGRIADVVDTEIFDTQLVMPRFAIGELQGIADSSDKLRRSRGRRGLDILNKLRSNPKVDLLIFDRDLAEFNGQPVDMKLVLLAKHLNGKIITNDYNLNKVAKLQGVGVINLNDLSNSLKPVYLPGESTEVRIVKPGEEAGQGIGYLDDGTMVVVEGGREHVNQMARVAVTSVLQTSAGRMVFGRYDGPGPGA